MDERWRQARRWLCVRLDAIGDVLMTTPAIRAVRESKPKAHITLLTSPAGAEAAALVPEIDEVMVYDAPWMKATLERTDSALDLAFIDRLARECFDAAIIFTVYSQNPLPSAMLCYLADIPLRMAYCRENPYQLLTDWQTEDEPHEFVRHEVRRQLDLVRTIGCRTGDERLSLHVPNEASISMEALLTREGLDVGKPWLVMHPGASAPSRRYPAELFAEVADQLALKRRYQIVLTGSAAEIDLVEHVRSTMKAPSLSLAGRIELDELAAVVRAAPVLISNNTGPVHIAAAVGTPVVDLYALTNLQHTPWAVPHRVLFHDVPCKNCYKSICPEGHHHCLTLVPPEEVVRAAVEMANVKRHML
ncbi:MAG: lipopolysaccharide heptosyltransferase II [Bacteroidota bacterium]